MATNALTTFLKILFSFGLPQNKSSELELPSPLNMTCEKNGKNYSEGDEWTSNNFRYKCGQFGLYKILGERHFFERLKKSLVLTKNKKTLIQ